MSVRARKAQQAGVRPVAPAMEWNVVSRLEGVVTLEVALHLGAIALGAILRFFLLDLRPLSIEEGALALESHRIWQGQPPEALQQGPLTAYGTALMLAMFAGGDGAARLLPALFGSVLLAVPYLLRHALGREAAIVAAYGLALSPLMLFASRDVGSGIIPLTLGFLLWFAHAPGLKGATTGRAYGIALLLAALLASGPEGLTVGATLGAAALLSHPHFPRFASVAADARQIYQSLLWRRAAVVFAAAVLVVGTGFGTNLGGVQSVLVDVWARWAGSLGLGAPRSTLLLPIALYELPVLLFGITQLIRAIFLRNRTDMLLSYWAMLLLLLGMLQGSGLVTRVLLPLLPLYLLAARLVADSLPAARGAGRGWRWRTACVAVLVPMGVAVVLLNRASTPATDVPTPYLYGEAALIGVAGLAVGLLLEGRARIALAWMAVALLSSGYLVHSTAFLNYRMESLPRELVVGSQLSPFVRDAAGSAGYFSTHFRAGVTVDPQLRPVLEWYLRGAREVQYSAETSQGMGFAWAQPLPDQMKPGSERRPGLYTPAVDPGGVSWQEVWRWIVSRDGLVRPNQRDIIVRAPAGDW